MTPRARSGAPGGDDRVPRTIFQHAHRDGSNTFPANIFLAQGEVFLLMPDNFNGLDDLILWFLGGGTEAQTYNITVNIGSCDELFNAHTQTVNGIAVNTVINEYECLSLSVTHATVLANLGARDMIWIIVAHATGDETTYLVGAEVQET